MCCTPPDGCSGTRSFSSWSRRFSRWRGGIGRAVGGNLLSYAYAVEWPVFAGFVIFVWVKEMQRALRPPDPAEPDSDAHATDAAGSGAPATVRPRRDPPGAGRAGI